MKTTALFLLFSSAITATAAAAPQLVLPGEAFHGDEVPARDGETWLALAVTDGKARLQSVRLKVEAVADPLADDPGDRSARSVAAPGVEALVFLRGIAALKPGDVDGFVTSAQTVSVERPLRLGTGAAAPQLAVQCAKTVGADDAPDTSICQVTLSDGARTQVIHRTAGERAEADGRVFDDAVVTVTFAGDLDRDGRVDLVIDTSDHYNLDRPTLFLSGAAQPGALVGPVAQQALTGC
ncbi:hypothetical protein [Tahibacter caeni]|uniref:hypothetical protein n=1 Tax=Tahibacter caeni TaxID=1453545 RepID=UPI0021476DBD|nr:hypothetical protein [Tahibacter caeni]